MVKIAENVFAFIVYLLFWLDVNQDKRYCNIKMLALKPAKV